jgi:hypothetical protein
MPDMKERQSTDSDQGGEGTNSLHNKGWDAMTKDISNVENTEDKGKPLDDHTR